MKQARLIPLFFLVAFLCMFGECAAAVVHGPKIDPRDMAIDRQIAGMEEGSRIAHPHQDVGEQNAHQRVHGGESGLGKEAHATVASGAHNLPHSTGVGTGAGSAETHTGAVTTSVSGHHAGIGASHAGAVATEHHAGVNTNVGGAGEQAHTGATSSSGQSETGQTEVVGNQSAQEGNHGVFIGGNVGGGETTGSETASGGSAGSNRSIIEADTNVNLSGENPTANTNISVDTNASGGLLDANTTTNAGSAGQQITSPLSQEISSGGSAGSGETAGSGDSHHIIEADANLTGNPSVDVTVDTSAGGGLLDASAVTDAGTVNQQILSESSHETSSTSTSGTSSGTTSSGSADRSIIEADTNVNLSSESAGANVSIDPNASGGLVDLDTATNADTAEQELTSSAGLEVGMGANTIAGESELGTEIGAGSAAPPAGEAETGLEADVEGVGATEDTASDPADGLSTTSVPHL